MNVPSAEIGTSVATQAVPTGAFVVASSGWRVRSRLAPCTTTSALKKTDTAGQITGASVKAKVPVTSWGRVPAGSGGGSHGRSPAAGTQSAGAALKSTLASQMSLGEEM